MQYTASSFAQPLLSPFRPALLIHERGKKIDGLFPASARFEQHVGDLAGERWLVPAVRRSVALLSRLRVLQHGRVHLYLVYILVALVVLLAWQLRRAS